MPADDQFVLKSQVLGPPCSDQTAPWGRSLPVSGQVPCCSSACCHFPSLRLMSTVRISAPLTAKATGCVTATRRWNVNLTEGTFLIADTTQQEWNNRTHDKPEYEWRCRKRRGQWGAKASRMQKLLGGSLCLILKSFLGSRSRLKSKCFQKDQSRKQCVKWPKVYSRQEQGACVVPKLSLQTDLKFNETNIYISKTEKFWGPASALDSQFGMSDLPKWKRRPMLQGKMVPPGQRWKVRMAHSWKGRVMNWNTTGQMLVSVGYSQLVKNLNDVHRNSEWHSKKYGVIRGFRIGD